MYFKNGIFYSADQQNPEKMKRFEIIKKAIPQYEELKAIYLQIRQAGLEDELYKGIDLNNINYSELLEKATNILEKNAKIDEIQQSKNEQNQVEVADIDVETIEKVTEETEQNNSTSIEINEFGEIIRHGNVEKTRELEISEEITQTKKSKEVKKVNEEKTRPMEESIRDEIGDEVKNTEHQMQVENPQITDLWLNRFSSWYSAIDRVSQNVKAKFVKMKSDIIKAISDKIKERSSKQEISKNQDENERQECVLKPEYREAFEEIYEIFNLMPKELLNKIPTKFL